MDPRRKLFLHVGCGKTGSSALQNWLRENSRQLWNERISYPLHAQEKARSWSIIGQRRRDGYEITSGNGVRLHEAALSGNAGEIIEHDIGSGGRDILYSSERLQNIKPSQLVRIRESAEKFGLDTVVIIFVRDLYDVMYSLYLQLVKRQGYARGFHEFGLGVGMPQQFKVLRDYEGIFDDIRVFHYDSERKLGIDRAFLRALGVSADRVPPMDRRTVNRSLSVVEAEVLRRANGVVGGVVSDGGRAFSTDVSDSIIYRTPERETEVFLDSDVLESFESRFGEEVRRVNERYFGDHRLKIFSPEGKKVVTESPCVEEAFEVVLRKLVEHTNAAPPGGLMKRLTGRQVRQSVSGTAVGATKPSGEIRNPGGGNKPRFRGWVDRADGRGLWGWVTRCSDPSDGLEVIVILDGVPVGRARCERERPDVAHAGIHPTGKCGFSFKWPAGAVSPGPHDVEVQVLDDVSYRFQGRFVA